MRIVTQHRWLLVASLLLVQLTTPAHAQTTVTQQLVTDPGLAAGPNGHGSKLGAHDSIIITRNIHTTLPPTAASPAENLPGDTDNSKGVCYSLRNISDTSYFVPWESALEWRQFLVAIGAPYQLALMHNMTLPSDPASRGWVSGIKMSTCCMPQEVGTICQGLNGDIISHDQLGYRYNDSYTEGNLPNWGAQGDIYGPVYASSVGGDTSINFEVTYACQNGAWVKTRSQGSCIPLDGQCATGTSTLTALPSDTTTLCAPGSIIRNLQGPSTGPWTWTCEGTPGRAVSSCSTGPTDGQCGTQAGQPFVGWGGLSGPYGNGQNPSENLCANGTTPTTVTGPDRNIAKRNGGTTYVPNLYHWKCKGIGGSRVNATCSAPEATGLCGIDGSWSDTAPSPTTDYFCAIGTPTNLSYGPSGWGGWWSQYQAWNWQCVGTVNQEIVKDNCSIFDNNQPMPGTCGDTADSFVTSSTLPPSRNLCGDGNTASTPVFVTNPGRTPYWFWTCAGPHGGSTASCSANYDPTPPACGPANDFDSIDAPPTAQLCVSPSAPTAAVWSNGSYWIWSCRSPSGNVEDCGAHAIYVAECGSSNGVASSDQPNNPCGWGSDLRSMSSDSSTWNWQCGGANNSITNCSAPKTDAPRPPATCGIASGSSASAQPTANLCGEGGFATNITYSQSSGAWVWTCTSGSTAVQCSASDTTSAPGICGDTNLTSIPNRPNASLCASGEATIVAGNGPWTWTCLGKGQYAGQNENCSAQLCGACVDSITQNMSTTPRSTVLNSSNCVVQGYSTWSQTDTISPADTTRTISWNDAFNGTFSKTIVAQSAGASYCPPCFRTPQSISNVQTIIHGTPGSCPSDSQINSGNPVTLTPTGVGIR